MPAPKLNRRALLVAGASLLESGLAVAQPSSGQFPAQPVRMVMPLPVGGIVDTTARIVGEEFQKVSGQPMLIDSKPGGAWLIGAQAALGLPADGYTVLNVNYSMVAAQAALKKLDLLNQFTGVAPFGFVSTAIVVAADSPFRSMEDLLAFGRSNPGKLNYAIPGPGSAEHLCCLQIVEGFGATALAFRGAPEMIVSVIQKDSHFAPVAVGLGEPFVRRGQLRFLAVNQNTRVASLPDVPAISESGLKVTPFISWIGLMARKETPLDHVRKLHALFTDTLESREVVARLKAVNMDAMTSKSAADFTALIRQSLDDLTAVVARSGLKFG